MPCCCSCPFTGKFLKCSGITLVAKLPRQCIHNKKICPTCYSDKKWGAEYEFGWLCDNCAIKENPIWNSL